MSRLIKVLIALFLVTVILSPILGLSYSNTEVKSETNKITLDNWKKADPNTKDQIINKISSTDEKIREQGLVELFETCVKSDYKAYLYGKSSKEERDRLTQFYDQTKDLRAATPRESSGAIVNLWLPLTNLVAGASALIKSIFPDITITLPDVFGRFDHNSTDFKTEAYKALNPSENKPFKLNGVELINMGLLYNSLLFLIIPLFGLINLVKFVNGGVWTWETLIKQIKSIGLFLVMVILAPSLFSFIVLSGNALNLSIYSLADRQNVSTACQEDKTMLCAYRTSYENLAYSEAIYAQSNQVVDAQTDTIKYIQVVFVELLQNFLTFILYLASVLVGIAALFFWKGVVLSIFITFVYMAALLPFSLLFPGWSLRWFNLVVQNLLSMSGFSLAYVITVSLIIKLAGIPLSLGYWTISVVFILTGFLLYRILPLISSIFSINLTYSSGLYGQGKEAFKHVFDRSKRRVDQVGKSVKAIAQPKKAFKNMFKKTK